MLLTNVVVEPEQRASELALCEGGPAGRVSVQLGRRGLGDGPGARGLSRRRTGLHNDPDFGADGLVDQLEREELGHCAPEYRASK